MTASNPFARTLTKGNLTVEIDDALIYFTVYDQAGNPQGTITRPTRDRKYWTVSPLSGHVLPSLCAGPYSALCNLHRHLNRKA